MKTKRILTTPFISYQNNYRCLYSDREGFALFEVMVATALFAIAAVGLSAAFNDTIEAALSLQRESEIRVGLQSKLAELMVEPMNPVVKEEPDEASGVIYTKQIQILELRDMSNVVLNGMFLLTVTANWKERGEAQSTRADVYVYR